MEFLMDPSIWIGLFTLVALEIVLGIDNLVFIAILADKLPPSQRDRARIIGLSLALFMRLGLLSVISWLVSLTTPLFTWQSYSFSGRDLILLAGGIFLVFKATMELHERLEGTTHHTSGERSYAGFWLVVTQIIVLDAVFSLDSVITAVGMVDQLWVMMAAVVIAVAVMLLASKPLTQFVSRHPTVVVLCLSFLLMIGFSLIAEGFGMHIPKGYLYAAIGFSILIETLNQVALKNFTKNEERKPLRERTADTILRLIGGNSPTSPSGEDVTETIQGKAMKEAFGEEERQMISGVLTLADRSIRRIMTPRNDISWLNTESTPEELRAQMLATPHSLFPVCEGAMDQIIGVMRAKELYTVLEDGCDIRTIAAQHPPIMVPDQMDVIKVMSVLRKAKGSLVLIVDEYGIVQGLITPHDVLEAIAGEFPDADETPDIIRDDTGWLVKGSTDLYQLEQTLGNINLVDTDDEFVTIAGLLLAEREELPQIGEIFEIGNYRFTIREISDRRIELIHITPIPPEE